MDALGLFGFEETASLLGVSASDSRKLFSLAKAEGFKGEAGSVWVVHPADKRPAPRILVAGLGKKKEYSLEILRRACGSLARRSAAITLKELGIQIPRVGTFSAFDEARAAAEGALLASYKFLKHKSKSDEKPSTLASLFVISGSGGTLKETSRAVDRASLICDSVTFVRDWVNEPPSLKAPMVLAKLAQSIAKNGIRANVFEEADLKRMGMGGILGVGRGSLEPPVLIHLSYHSPQARRTIALVGKGITFDSGGLSLKPAESMETMKMDMAGGISVIGIFRALAKLKPKVNVEGYIPSSENMPGGRAYKPGDILKTYNGKTIEVLNTDAEGRVVLADALAYAAKKKPDAIIDMATLTGAVIVALGEQITGVMGNNEDLISEVKSAFERSGEKCWQLPLPKEYKEQIKSRVADVKNIGNRREAGSIVGGLFLQEFVNDVPWIHLDIAGTAWTDKDLAYSSAGGTGCPVRSIIEFLEKV